LRKPKNKVIKISRSDNKIGATYWLIACLKKRQNPRTMLSKALCFGISQKNTTNKLPSFVDRFQILSHKQQALHASEGGCLILVSMVLKYQ
jgi:hypothetical protein